eukprot:8348562-Pyramimonas_sp.AAC.1
MLQAAWLELCDRQRREPGAATVRHPGNLGTPTPRLGGTRAVPHEAGTQARPRHSHPSVRGAPEAPRTLG